MRFTWPSCIGRLPVWRRVWCRKRSQGADSARARQPVLADALDACEKLTQTLFASLARYEPELLGAYRAENVWCSSLLEYLGIVGQRRVAARAASPRPCQSSACDLAPAIWHGGHRIPLAHRDTRRRDAGHQGVSRRPALWACTTGFLSAPFAFVATQSFSFLTKSTGQSLLQRQFNRMANAGDFAVSQAAELKDALDALTSNEFVMGDHHFSLQVLADVVEPGADGSRGDRLKPLNDHIALARSYSRGYRHAGGARGFGAWKPPFGRSCRATFRFGRARRRSPREISPRWRRFTTIPSAARTAITGEMRLSLFVTSARSPYYFSLHASDPADPDGGSRKDTGHTLICGPTGSGKTVFIGFLVAMLSRQGVTQVIFDKDRGLEILVRALGGEYLPLKNGVPTGFNPLQLPSHAGECRIPEGLAARAERSASSGSAPQSRAVRRGSRSGSGAARHLGARTGSAAPVAAGRISRSDRSGRAACAARALVRIVPRRLRLGIRQSSDTVVRDCPGRTGRLRRNGISRSQR